MNRLVVMNCGLLAVALSVSACSKGTSSSTGDTAGSATPAGIATLAADSTATTTTVDAGAATAGSTTTGTTATAAAAGATAPDAAAVAAAAIAGMAGAQGGSGQTINYSKGDEKLSMGVGTAEDLSSSGVPMYPAIAPAQSHVIKHSTATETTFTLTTKVTDEFKTVDDWYASKLGSDFKASRLDVSGMKMTTFEKEAGTAHDSILLQSTKDGDASTTTITVVVDDKKS